MWDLQILSFDLFFIAIYRILRQFSSLSRTFKNVSVHFIKHLFSTHILHRILEIQLEVEVSGAKNWWQAWVSPYICFRLTKYEPQTFWTCKGHCFTLTVNSMYASQRSSLDMKEFFSLRTTWCIRVIVRGISLVYFAVKADLTTRRYQVGDNSQITTVIFPWRNK